MHPLFTACRHPAVRQRPRGCALRTCGSRIKRALRMSVDITLPIHDGVLPKKVPIEIEQSPQPTLVVSR